jgi:hypothetical protein
MKKIKKYQNGSTGLFDAGSNTRSGIDAGLLGASFIPGVGYAANLASSGLSLYDAYNAKTPEARNEAFVDAGISLIPGGKILRGITKGVQKTRNVVKAGNVINKTVPAFEKGTKNINSNNMKMKKYDGGTQGAQPSRYQKLDAKLGGLLPGGVSRSQAKAMKAAKNSSSVGSVGPMAGGYATPSTPTGKSFGPLAGNYMPANIDLNKPVGPMTDIKQYTNPKNMPSSKTAGTAVPATPATKGKVNFKKPAGKKALGGGYRMYEDMNIDQQRQYREGMASGKDFTVTVADKYGKNKELKYGAATKGGAELSKKRNTEYDKRYQDDLIKKMPDTKNIEKHDHLLRHQDEVLANAKAQFDARHKGKVSPTPVPKTEEDDDGFGFLKGLAGAGAAAGLYYGGKKLLKRFGKPGKIVSTGLDVAEKAVPVIKRNAQKLLPAAKETVEKVKSFSPEMQKAAQEAFNFLNIKRLPGAAKEGQKILNGRKPQLLLGSGK